MPHRRGCSERGAQTTRCMALGATPFSQVLCSPLLPCRLHCRHRSASRAGCRVGRWRPGGGHPACRDVRRRADRTFRCAAGIPAPSRLPAPENCGEPTACPDANNFTSFTLPHAVQAPCACSQTARSSPSPPRSAGRRRMMRTGRRRLMLGPRRAKGRGACTSTLTQSRCDHGRSCLADWSGC